MWSRQEDNDPNILIAMDEIEKAIQENPWATVTLTQQDWFLVLRINTDLAESFLRGADHDYFDHSVELVTQVQYKLDRAALILPVKDRLDDDTPLTIHAPTGVPFNLLCGVANIVGEAMPGLDETDPDSMVGALWRSMGTLTRSLPGNVGVLIARRFGLPPLAAIAKGEATWPSS